MKLTKNKYDKKYYLQLTKECFAHTINDWVQLFGKWNWYSFHFIHLYVENDIMTGGYEFEFVVLGLGFRFRYNYAFEESKAGKRFSEYEKKNTKKSKKKNKTKKK